MSHGIKLVLLFIKKFMSKENNKKKNESPYTGKHHGPQGIDKPPGEEVSEDNVQFSQETQKGKKVDADFEREKDRPKDQNLGND